jgi:predicted metal-dependent enzyme (double-stranded beta helix superfamily)
MATGATAIQSVDEYIVDTPGLRKFIDDVRAAVGRFPDDVAAGLASLRPSFARLLADQSWLPDQYADICTTGGMGGGIGQWLLFRSADRSLSLFSLVIPAGSATPVHDHLAWGLVGLYRGEQEETVYRRIDDGSVHDHAELLVDEVRPLHPGDFYVLLPPTGDIHGVRTTSGVASVSIHLLGNDAGCVWRHAFEPAADRVRSFRSGYTNMPCVEAGSEG